MCHPEVPLGERAPEITREEVRVPLSTGEALPGLLARPSGGAAPGVLIVPDIFGPTPFYEQIAERLATAGFTALLADYFFRQGPIPPRHNPPTDDDFRAAYGRLATLDEQRCIQDLLQCLDWLHDRTAGTAERTRRGSAADTKSPPSGHKEPAGRIGTIGFCLGGTLVLHLAAERGNLATICYYGFPAASREAMVNRVPPPLERIDQIRGPIIGFWGDQDEGVGIHNVEAMARALHDRNVEFNHVIYPGLGHGFLARSGLDPKHEAYDRACDSWTRAVRFLRHHVAEPQRTVA